MCICVSVSGCVLLVVCTLSSGQDVCGVRGTESTKLSGLCRCSEFTYQVSELTCSVTAYVSTQSTELCIVCNTHFYTSDTSDHLYIPQVFVLISGLCTTPHNVYSVPKWTHAVSGGH